MTNIKSITYSIIFPWLLMFLLINVVSRGNGGTNALSRFATMKSMSEEQTFKINKYVDWTFDWAQTPDGNYYSNKAPGPMFLAFPIFFIIDKLGKIVTPKNKYSEKTSPTPQMLVSILSQVVPWLTLICLTFLCLQKLNFSTSATLFTTLALLFGNTSSLFMNSFFGHGMAAILMVATIISLLKNNFFWTGLSYGWLLLTDYSAAFFLPGLIIALVIRNKKDLSWMKFFILGGIVPGMFWLWYHIACFGSPFVVASRYQNPMFQDVQGQESLFGIFSSQFKPSILVELIFGTKRGLLFTQPWVLLIPAMIMYNWKRITTRMWEMLALAVPFFIFLLLMNTQFGGWHGGHSAGPRYLALSFPPLCFLAGSLFDSTSRRFQAALWIFLIITIAINSLVYAGTVLVPSEAENMLSWLFQEVFFNNSKKPLMEFIIFWLAFSISLIFSFKKINIPTLNLNQEMKA